ncbi:MAG: hypothetical protein R2838_15560 [Caldilineaceae bacterium]
MAPTVMFAGLVFDEDENPAEVAYVGTDAQEVWWTTTGFAAIDAAKVDLAGAALHAQVGRWTKTAISPWAPCST